MKTANSATMPTNSTNYTHWTTYLPEQCYGLIETYLQRSGGSLIAPILSEVDVQADRAHNIWANSVDVCIRNITHRFPDGPTYFCLVGSKVPTAMIIKFAYLQCIVISSALPDAVLGLALKMCTSSALRDYIDSGTKPGEARPPFPRSRKEALEYVFQTDRDISHSVQEATLVLYISAYFLSAHELGHLALGHLEKLGSTKAAIIENEPIDTSDPVLSRTMEWDADIFAGAATNWYIGQLGPLGDPGWGKIFSSAEKNLRIFSITAYSLFTIMDLVVPEATDQAKRTHPAPLVRVGLMNAALAVVIGNWGVLSRDQVLDEAREAIRCFEIALHEIGGGNMSRPEAEALQRQAEADLEEVGATFQRIEEQLDRSRLSDLFFARWLGPN